MKPSTYAIVDMGDSFEVVNLLWTPTSSEPESVNVPKDHPGLIAACRAAGITLPGVAA